MSIRPRGRLLPREVTVCDLWGTTIAGLTAAPITIAETPRSDRTWACVARASESMTAAVLVQQGDRLIWTKASRDGEEVPFSLLVTPPDPKFRGVHLGVSSGSAAYTLYCEAPSESPLRIVMPQAGVTGSFIRLATFSAMEEVHVGMLLVSRHDVKFGRTRLWRLRTELSVAEPLWTMLGPRRSGEFRLSDL